MSHFWNNNPNAGHKELHSAEKKRTMSPETDEELFPETWNNLPINIKVMYNMGFFFTVCTV